MHLNRLSRLARNICQPYQWSPRITSFFTVTRNRNDSSSFFVRTENHESQGNVQQHVRRVKQKATRFYLRTFVQLFHFQTSTESSLVSSLKNLSRRVKFYDRSPEHEPNRWVTWIFVGPRHTIPFNTLQIAYDMRSTRTLDLEARHQWSFCDN